MDLARFYNVFGTNYDGKPHVMSYFLPGSIDEASMHNAELTAGAGRGALRLGLGLRRALPPEQPDPGRRRRPRRRARSRPR